MGLARISVQGLKSQVGREISTTTIEKSVLFRDLREYRKTKVEPADKPGSV